MEQVLKYVDVFYIPTYAVYPLEMGDCDGMSEEDIDNIKAFDKKLCQLCPDGMVFQWENADNPYFYNYPAFGKPTDVIDLRLYKVVNFMQKKPAYINGRDVDDDFEFLHDNEFVEKSVDPPYSQLFWNNGCCCVLNYSYGDSGFSVHVSDVFGGDLEAAMEDLNKRCFDCCSNCPDLILETEVVDNLLTGEYYFIEPLIMNE